jgi:pimeloyl-ACP methyl ester carboxylesterase
MKRQHFRHTIFVGIGLAVILLNFQQCNTPMKNVETTVPKDSVVGAANVATQYVEKDGRKIAYRKVGSGPAMILCNRFRGTLDDWDPLFIDELARKHTVITFDYSGIGLSTLKDPADSLTETMDVKDLASALNLNKVVLVGWSHGGKVAQYVTVHDPELVSHLILIGTGPMGKNEYPSEKVFLNTR